MKTFLYILIFTFLNFNTSNASQKSQIKFINNISEKKVDVIIDGKFFTAFIYPENIDKQVLFPILSPSGKFVTRGFPIDPRPFERADHPHHIGLWFNFGDVNGLDFWNNSYAIKDEVKAKYGSIKFDRIVSLNSKKGELVCKSYWVNNKGDILLSETTTFLFSGDKKTRCIVRKSELQAVKDLVFTQNKEGLIGLRVDRAFEEPMTKPEKLLDKDGKIANENILNNEGLNGEYRNAEGIKGGEVWGKRSKWVALKAKKENEIISIVIIDHPHNLNYPAWSHARGYGLFATNNLAGSAVDKNSEMVKVILKPGEKINFVHKIVIGGNLTDKEINKLAHNF